MYDAWLALHREDKAFVRLQINFLHNQGFIAELGDLDHQLPELRERLKNQFPFFGDDMLRTGGIGEWAAPFAAPGSAGYPVWYESQRLVAKARWRNENAQGGSPTSSASIEQVVATYEAMDAGIRHQGLALGLAARGLRDAEPACPPQEPELRRVDVRLPLAERRTARRRPAGRAALSADPRERHPAGMHEDGVHIAPHNPWFALHYATTGLNVLGQQINPGQQITRQQALYAYTRGNAWYLNRENDLGSIEEGKLADLVVLDRDYFSVSDADMRKTRPVLTVVDGEIVHDAGVI